MSVASERKAVADNLSMYPLMTVGQLAAFLHCSPDHARGMIEDGVIPSTDIGRGKRHEYRVDPMDAAVFHLAQREGITPEEFWREHGPEGTPQRCLAMVRFIRRTIQAAA